MIQAVAKQLHIKTSKELHDLREVLFPSILCAMVHAGAATTKLEILKVKYGADMAMVNYDGRTPLHVAAAEGTYFSNILSSFHIKFSFSGEALPS